MTKQDKYKEKSKVKVLEPVSGIELAVMYQAIAYSKPGEGSKDHWRKKDTLFDLIMGDHEPDKNGQFSFDDRDEMVLKLGEHELLMREVDNFTYQSMPSRRIADKLIERLINCETFSPEKESKIEDPIAG